MAGRGRLLLDEIHLARPPPAASRIRNVVAAGSDCSLALGAPQEDRRIRARLAVRPRLDAHDRRLLSLLPLSAAGRAGAPPSRGDCAGRAERCLEGAAAGMA